MVGGKGPCIVGCGKCSRELANLLVAWRRVGGRHADNQSSKWRVALEIARGRFRLLFVGRSPRPHRMMADKRRGQKPIRIGRKEMTGNERAHRESHDVRPLDFQMIQQPDDVPAHFRAVRRGVVRPATLAVPAAVERDHPMISRKVCKHAGIDHNVVQRYRCSRGSTQSQVPGPVRHSECERHWTRRNCPVGWQPLVKLTALDSPPLKATES